MEQKLLSEIADIQRQLRTKMTESQKSDWQRLLDRRLDALDRLYNPVDQWGRSRAQQLEDAANPCLCRSPTKTDNLVGCCGLCGLWRGAAADAAHERCQDCRAFVPDLAEHRKTCEDFMWNEMHCDECGRYPAHVAEALGTYKRCWCAYDQDDINKMDLINRRGF